MLKSNSARWAIILCFALMAAGCGDDSGPTAPTVVAPPTGVAPEPQPVTLTGIWSGSVVGVFVIGDARAKLTQAGTTVAGNWSMPMPLALIAAGAPADLALAGPVSGTVTDTTAALSFGLLDALALLVGSVECAVDVSVTSFDETTMEATWKTNEACQMPFVDQGTLSFMRQ